MKKFTMYISLALLLSVVFLNLNALSQGSSDEVTICLLGEIDIDNINPSLFEGLSLSNEDLIVEPAEVAVTEPAEVPITEPAEVAVTEPAAEVAVIEPAEVAVIEPAEVTITEPVESVVVDESDDSGRPENAFY